MGYNEEGIGYQKTDTSKEAAQFNKEGKLTIREQVKTLFAEGLKLTSEEVCHILSELKNDGYLQDSGDRRLGKWGTNIIVWEYK